jgi:hypothetical protein
MLAMIYLPSLFGSFVSATIVSPSSTPSRSTVVIANPHFPAMKWLMVDSGSPICDFKQAAVARWALGSLSGDAGVPEMVGLINDDGMRACGNVVEVALPFPAALQVAVVKNGEAGSEYPTEIGQVAVDRGFPNG